MIIWLAALIKENNFGHCIVIFRKNSEKSIIESIFNIFFLGLWLSFTSIIIPCCTKTFIRWTRFITGKVKNLKLYSKLTYIITVYNVYDCQNELYYIFGKCYVLEQTFYMFHSFLQLHKMRHKSMFATNSSSQLNMFKIPAKAFRFPCLDDLIQTRASNNQSTILRELECLNELQKLTITVGIWRATSQDPFLDSPKQLTLRSYLSSFGLTMLSHQFMDHNFNVQ